MLKRSSARYRAKVNTIDATVSRAYFSQWLSGLAFVVWPSCVVISTSLAFGARSVTQDTLGMQRVSLVALASLSAILTGAFLAMIDARHLGLSLRGVREASIPVYVLTLICPAFLAWATLTGQPLLGPWSFCASFAQLVWAGIVFLMISLRQLPFLSAKNKETL